MADLHDLRIPAHRFRQGGRDVYACVLNLPSLNARLPDRIEDRVVREANRQLTPSHARRIRAYLAESDDWVLGALMLGVPADAVEFRPYVEGDGAPMHVGELRIRAESSASMKMFDGQHRRRAIKDVLAELEVNVRQANKLSALEACSLPIMLYVEDDIGALRQMFADAAQTKSIDANVVARFDLRDPFNLAALWLEENSGLFAGRVEKERASVPRPSECIVAINQLSVTLKTLEVGYRGRVSRDLSSQYMLALDDLNERCWVWSDDFMPAAREEYEWLVAGEIDNSDIPMNRTTSMAYNATVIRLFAGCYYEWTKDGAPWEPLAEFIRSASLKPAGGRGALLVDAGLVAEDGVTPFARAQLVSAAIDHIVLQARSASG